MDRHQHSSLWKVRVSRQLFSCEVVPKPSLDFVVFCDFVGLLGFLSFEEKRGEMRTGAPLQHPGTCPVSARPEAFRAGMQPGSALMLPWEAEFPLKIDWLYWGRGLEGAGESLAANNPAPIQARFPVPVADIRLI